MDSDKPEIKDKIGIREFARRVGVSDTTIHKAIKAGKIPKSCLDHTNPKRPEIYPDKALEAWGRNYAPGWNQSTALNEAITTAKQNTDSIPAPAPAKTKPVVKPEPSPAPPANENESDQSPDELLNDNDFIRLPKDSEFSEAKRVEAIAQAKLSQVKLAEMKGKLVSKDKVYKDFFDVGVRVRASLQGLPDKIIDSLLACDNRSEAHSMLYREITEALESLILSENNE